MITKGKKRKGREYVDCMLSSRTCIMVTLVGRNIRGGQVRHHPSPMSSWAPLTFVRHDKEWCSKHDRKIRVPRTQVRDGCIGRTQHPRRADETSSLTKISMTSKNFFTRRIATWNERKRRVMVSTARPADGVPEREGLFPIGCKPPRQRERMATHWLQPSSGQGQSHVSPSGRRITILQAAEPEDFIARAWKRARP